MKKTIYTLMLLFVASLTQAQDINKIITKDYVDHLIKTLASDDGVPFSEVAKKIAFRDRGRVVMRWDRPITKDMFGIPDEFMGIGLESNGVQFTKTSIWFPDYFWEKWSDSISYYWNDFF